MSSPVRRSLLLATVLALLLGVSGIAASVGLARGVTATTVAGIDDHADVVALHVA